MFLKGTKDNSLNRSLDKKNNLLLKDIPGPCHYNPNKFWNKREISSSFKSKTLR